MELPFCDAVAVSEDSEACEREKDFPRVDPRDAWNDEGERQHDGDSQAADQVSCRSNVRRFWNLRHL